MASKLGYRGLTCACVVVALCLASAAYADASVWKRSAGPTPDPATGMTVCSDAGPQTNDAALTLSAVGPTLWLGIDSPRLPAVTSLARVVVTVDGDSVGSLEGQIKDHRVRAGMSPQEAAPIAKAARLTLTVNDQSFDFDIGGVDKAFDDVTACAGQPSLAQRLSIQQPVAITGAEGWMLLKSLPQADRACVAIISGPDVKVLAGFDPDGALRFTIGQTGWFLESGRSIPVQMSIDGGAPIPISVDQMSSLVRFPVKDAALVEQLRDAHALDLTLANGKHRAYVQGLGVALDAVKECLKGGAAPPGLTK